MKQAFSYRYLSLRFLFAAFTAILGLQISRPAQAAFTFAEHSLLASGKWVKISVARTGIHRISYSDLRKWGFSDPTKVKVYGYGGALLSENFLDTFSDDLPAVPVCRTGETLLFYAQGPVTWKYNSLNKCFEHTNNCYSDLGYYFLTENNEPDFVPRVLDTDTEAAKEVTDFYDFLLHESELVNIGKTGREFYGEDFRFTQTQTFPFDIPGLLPDEAIINIDFIAKTVQSGEVTVNINGKKVLSGTVTSTSVSDHYTLARSMKKIQAWQTDGAETQTVQVQYNRSGDDIARLNYIGLTVRRKLQLYDGSVIFEHAWADQDILRYRVGLNGSAATQVRIWDITDYKNPAEIKASVQGSDLTFTSAAKGIRRYVAFDIQASYPAVTKVGEVGNQDIHACQPADLVIITHPALRSQAERLAAFHQEKDGLTTLVVEPEPLYNEFSSGTPDATAYRLFMKMLYDRGGKQAGNPKYLLLFGDGTYDNRLITTEWKALKATLLLTYQNENAINDRKASPVDDYFGFLSDNQLSFESETVKVGIGRFPVRNLSEATIAVDKVIAYANNTQYGSWKNNLCFIADDDADTDSQNLHIRQADSLCKAIEKKHPEFIPNRIFLDSYKKVITANSQSSPDAKKQFFDLLEEGQLLVNYIGHGSTRAWADENILNVSDIRKLYLKRLPVFITATCDFSRFDDITTSAGEELFLNPKGGGIALFTTTRVVYSTENFDINLKFINYIFSRDQDGNRLRLGDIIRLSKEKMSGDNRLKFVLLGDPALTLAYPEYSIRITEINNESISDVLPTIQAKSRVLMKGEILRPDGTEADDFNGIIVSKIFDSPTQKVTLDNNDRGYTFTYKDRTNVLYQGKDSVRNGEFTFQFKVPKEINYSYESGLVNLYAYDSNKQNAHEAQGAFDGFLVGGMDENAEEDTEGPAIHGLYLNTRDFANGDIVNETPTLIADIEDPSGFNISGSSIGHDITATIDDDPLQRYVVNNYYTSDFGQFGKGSVIYNMPEIAEGTHTLTFKVWDTENNSSEQSVTFEVKKGYKPQIYSLYATSNPARSNTTFLLTHNRPNAVISIRISVYDLSGTEVWNFQDEDTAEMYSSFPIEWNLTDKNGNRLQPGIYVYRAYISSEGGQEATESKKLVVLGD